MPEHLNPVPIALGLAIGAGLGVTLGATVGAITGDLRLWIALCPSIGSGLGLLAGIIWSVMTQPTPKDVCANCGYSLKGLDGGVCPECGADPNSA